MIILLMGVSGSGKSTIGKELADSLQWEFRDADTFHSPENIEKMRHGIPLSDGDRIPWLQDLLAAIKQWLEDDQNMVLACSALKAGYRKYLMPDEERIKLVYLKGSFQVIEQRLRSRPHHYMSPELLQSQFETLEEPNDAITVDISDPPEVIVQHIRASLWI
ncbi:MAG: gluconokinase [Stigonema ocellatum SAG 48.90 = DSM 106950]|nr:gluconokinase [Stigonema ocellatum SAG 48.90 = DSM 106950]